MPSSSGPVPDISALHGLEVLLVEDSWHVAKGMKTVLEQLGMRVIGPTPTTAEAKQLVAAHNPKLALVDVNLKHEMAFDLINELHEQGIQVLVISGYATISVPRERIAGFLQKPFSGPELIALLGAIVPKLH
jgi:YesN/AraC family two-component response regulator